MPSGPARQREIRSIFALAEPNNFLAKPVTVSERWPVNEPVKVDHKVYIRQTEPFPTASEEIEAIQRANIDGDLDDWLLLGIRRETRSLPSGRF